MCKTMKNWQNPWNIRFSLSGLSRAQKLNWEYWSRETCKITHSDGPCETLLKVTLHKHDAEDVTCEYSQWWCKKIRYVSWPVKTGTVFNHICWYQHKKKRSIRTNWANKFTFRHSEGDITHETCAINGKTAAAVAAAALAVLRPVGALRTAPL